MMSDSRIPSLLGCATASAVRPDRDYVLGTDDEEVRRLGIQHEAWYPTARQCWDEAGFQAGDRIIDIGAGPGFAALDLARLVGDGGCVTAVERSSHFVQAGISMVRESGASNVEYFEIDLMTDPLPGGVHDAAWCRWVCSFVPNPALLVAKIASALRPGGVVALHEYVDYASWRFSPALPMVHDYIATVMRSWRRAGGEPDIAMTLLPLLAAEGLVVERAEPLVYCVGPEHPLWNWISTFIESNVSRLVELGDLDRVRAHAVRAEFRAAAQNPASLMLTPMVLEIIARKRIGASLAPEGDSGR